MKIMDNFTR
jgi:hypothetical protein